MSLPYIKGSETSVAAAIAMEPRAPTGKGRVLDLLRRRGALGATDCEMQVILEMNPSTQRPRRVELFEAGLIAKLESRFDRATMSGHRASVWIADSVIGTFAHGEYEIKNGAQH
jgi:hypothetical protein